MGAVDWGLARRIATGVAGDPGTPALVDDLAGMCDDARERVVAYTGLVPLAALPAPEAVGRPGWLEANLASMRGVLEPVAERMARSTQGPPAVREAMRAVAGLLLGAEVGGLVGLLAQRVLGQYEVPPLDPARPARLLFVAPNLREAARRLGAEEDELVRWVALHEVTHAVQFGSVPWLREHVAGLLGELLAAMEVRVDLRRLVLRGGLDDLRGAVERLRHEGLLAAVLGSERRALLDRVQATMAMIEGHAEHVMDAAGREALGDIDRLRAALERRRHDRPPLMRLLERLLGLELKMRQYEVGKGFCDEVVRRAGVQALNRAWERPEALPSWAELEDPGAWLSRVAA